MAGPSYFQSGWRRRRRPSSRRTIKKAETQAGIRFFSSWSITIKRRKFKIIFGSFCGGLGLHQFEYCSFYSQSAHTNLKLNLGIQSEFCADICRKLPQIRMLHNVQGMQTPPPVAQADFSLLFQNKLTGALGEDESNVNAASGHALTCENCFNHNGLVRVIPSQGKQHSTLITGSQTICNHGRRDSRTLRIWIHLQILKRYKPPSDRCEFFLSLILIWMVPYHSPRHSQLDMHFRGRRLRCIHPNITSRLPRISAPINVLFSYFTLTYYSCEPDSSICFWRTIWTDDIVYIFFQFKLLHINMKLLLGHTFSSVTGDWSRSTKLREHMS